MRLYRIGFALAMFSFLSPVFANNCPSADTVRQCNGDQCAYQRFPGWSNNIYYMDKGKPFAFKSVKTTDTSQGTQVSCYYTYLDPDTHEQMPTAVMLRTFIN
jgi:hypothetical protein